MVISVNGEVIEEALVKQEFERLRPEYVKVFADQTPEEQDKQLLEWSKENLVERVLLRQEAEKRPDIDGDEVEAAFEQVKKRLEGDEQFEEQIKNGGAEEIKKQIALQMKMEGLIADVSKEMPEPSEEAIKELYEQNKGNFKNPERVRVSHVVKHINGFVDSKTALQEIEKAKAELAGGAIFEEVVAKYSDCKDNAGDLGYIERGLMVEEFEDVVFNLGPNEVSDIFKSRYGYHIVKLYDRRPETTAALEEVKDTLVKQLEEQIKKELLDTFLDELKKGAKIEGV